MYKPRNPEEWVIYGSAEQPSLDPGEKAQSPPKPHLPHRIEFKYCVTFSDSVTKSAQRKHHFERFQAS